MTVARLEEELGPDEIVYWEAYFNREPTAVQQQWMTAGATRAELRRLTTGAEVRFEDVMPADPWIDDGNP